MYYFSSLNFQDVVCYFLYLAYCSSQSCKESLLVFLCGGAGWVLFRSFPAPSIVWKVGNFSSCCWMVHLKCPIGSIWMSSFVWIMHINWPFFSLIFYQRFPGTSKEKGKIWCGFVSSVMFFCSSKTGKHGPYTNCTNPLLLLLPVQGRWQVWCHKTWFLVFTDRKHILLAGNFET